MKDTCSCYALFWEIRVVLARKRPELSAGNYIAKCVGIKQINIVAFLRNKYIFSSHNPLTVEESLAVEE